MVFRSLLISDMDGGDKKNNLHNKRIRMETKCWLFVPAKEKTLSKIKPTNEFVVIIDLEDSIPESDKDIALISAKEYIAENAKFCSNIVVRLNRCRMQRELQELSQWPVGFMIPKFEIGDELNMHESLLAGHRLIALIETPRGVQNVAKIASNDGVDVIAFGAEDFTATMNMENSNDFLLPIKIQLVTAAKANHKLVLDTPSFNVTDNTLFEQDVDYSIRIGFDGKMAIHPKHLKYIIDCFTRCDRAYLEFVINEYEKLGGGVQMIDGKVYEGMHINRLRKIIKESKI